MLIRSIDDLADVFGVSRPTIIEWQKEGMPVAARGRPGVASEYDSAACIRWYVNRKLRQSGTGLCSELAERQCEWLDRQLRAARGEPVELDVDAMEARDLDDIPLDGSEGEGL